MAKPAIDLSASNCSTTTSSQRKVLSNLTLTAILLPITCKCHQQGRAGVSVAAHTVEFNGLGIKACALFASFESEKHIASLDMRRVRQVKKFRNAKKRKSV